jgi:hypothetical protein
MFIFVSDKEKKDIKQEELKNKKSWEELVAYFP